MSVPWLDWMPRFVQYHVLRRRIQRRIDVINDRYRPKMAAAKTDRDQHSVDQEWTHYLEEDITDLGLIETERLERVAQRWNVDIPDDAWLSNLYQTERYISPVDQRKLWKEIQAVKRDSVRFWVQTLVMPLVAVLSLVVALLALWVRTKGTP